MSETKLSLSEYAYQELKEKILNMSFAPGKVLTEAMLSEMLGISRMPIRSAMQRLLEEGWLDNSNRKMVRVTSIEEKDVREVYDIRELVECGALKRIFDEDKTWDYSFELECIVVKIRAVYEDPFKTGLLDSDYHSFLVGVFQNQRLSKIFNSNREEILRMNMLYPQTKAEIQNVARDLTDLYNAIREKDFAAASRIHLQHLHTGRDKLLQALAKFTPEN